MKCCLCLKNKTEKYICDECIEKYNINYKKLILKIENYGTGA